jgi:octaprenyl-diphosphate synthase
MQQITDLIGDELQQVERGLIETLSSQVSLINQVSGYIIESGGKRFRPMIYLLAARCCNYTGKHNIPLACVFEYIHTATLLHDDVLDQAMTRRGNSSANSVWGDRASMLVGDYLFSKAFTMLVKIGNLRTMEVISDATTKVAEGETLQTARCNDPKLTEEEYITIVANKTGSLLEAASQVGAIMGDSSPAREKSFKEYGLNIGIAFQIADDTLDYVSDDQKFGKAHCKDLQEKKITLPLIHTLREASSQDKEEILGLLQGDLLKPPDVQRITDLIKKYQGVSYAHSKARDYIAASFENLKEVEPSPAKDALFATANYVVERKW